MNQSPPTPPYRGNKAITILRIFLWLLPAIILPFGIGLAQWLGQLAPLGWIATVGATGLVGYFDQRLGLQQKRVDSSTETGNLVRWSIIFVLLQCIIAPVIVFAVLYGYCMVTGFNI